MPYEKDPNEIGALWAKTSKKGTEFLSGTINGIDVVCFRNTKKTSDKQPEWKVLKSEPRDSGARTAYDNREAPRRESRVDDIERTYEDDGF